MDWDFDDQRPIYAQLVEQVERAVVSGIWPPGSRLPGVRELASEAGVNPNTMQRALAALEQGGLVYAQRTAGRFVTEDEALIADKRRSLAGSLAADFVGNMRALGVNGDELCRLVRAAAEAPKAAGAPP
ncbi:GntR family transcriptional regulator [Ruminococcaceae bacterium OttesenSCG-928-D13]|nr:GntR family transcriptional regulator [Ruminococcaceae bacterium OttesenSCG-928-D13]